MSIERLKKVWRDIAYKVSKEVLHDTYEGDLFKTYYLLNHQLFKHFVGNELTSLSVIYVIFLLGFSFFSQEVKLRLMVLHGCFNLQRCIFCFHIEFLKDLQPFLILIL